MKSFLEMVPQKTRLIGRQDQQRMLVMPANATGWFFHCLARETGCIGHLFSPGAQRGPWPWFPFALDNGAFSCWDRNTNTFDEVKWLSILPDWRELLKWASPFSPLWAIVPDVVGNREKTIDQWRKYAPEVRLAGIPLAVAVQDGMTRYDVDRLKPKPEVVAVGGSDDFKWGSIRMWAANFPRVHVLRCNSPSKLYLLEELGVESCDGTGWNRGDRNQTEGLEKWARMKVSSRTVHPLTPHVCRGRLR